jgi:DNA-binding MarR family transcriptional regulator
MPIDVSGFSRYSVPADSVGFLLRQLFMQWRQPLEAELAKIDLTHMQFVLLMGLGWLTRNGEGANQQKLSDFCKISRALASQTLSTLIRKKLVSRKSDPNDRRSNIITLTAAGEQRIREAVPILEAAEDGFLADAPGLRRRIKQDLSEAVDLVRARRPHR